MTEEPSCNNPYIQTNVNKNMIRLCWDKKPTVGFRIITDNYVARCHDRLSIKKGTETATRDAEIVNRF